MKQRFSFFIFLTLLMACNAKGTRNTTSSEQSSLLDTALMVELARMVEIDQIAAMVPKGKYKAYSNEGWQRFQDSVFTTHQKRLAEIFSQRGFPGYDAIGEEGSRNFWLMVQHSDFDPAFQETVLDAMKVQVDKANASPSDYAMLVDRVSLNTGKPQVYGTQVTYNVEICQVIPKSPLMDSIHVNERRADVGLEPLENYLNMMSEMHFEMNRANYEKQGITQPVLYPTASTKSDN
ncbi:DUF6624 domain-containing protein [Parapedobacter tibetensis]|uniref:DUF6624 domain-containing protein n=1 Tax=Parapedobacter tibetensis TaxID=2972951 RepID=UPI00214D955E|nr:DUF6624 domain-containing protein [Parapedobacter tibetensis]